ncbi:MAG: DUF4199 domain-containing protein [Chitinophagaceae bacterium]|nr:DUF4199 domain-containing protein [Chitinophagaceae bacterium]MCW5928960.1 DUF4199 domain-containing protein [Chitinophagaceae bacterium]
MENTKTNVGVTYGLISGLVAVVFGLVLYLMGAKAFVSPVAYLGILLPIIIAVLAGVKQKRLDGGYIDFAKALKVTFTTLVVGSFISMLFNYMLFNFIDVPFREALTQESAVKAAEMMKKFGATQEMIDKTMEDTLKGNNYSFGKQLLGTAFFCIVWFIVSLIISVIIKKKRPEFPQNFPETTTV